MKNGHMTVKEIGMLIEQMRAAGMSDEEIVGYILTLADDGEEEQPAEEEKEGSASAPEGKE